MKTLDSIPSIHREGYIFIAIGVIFSILSGAVFSALGWLSAFITVFVICFFRDPKRVSPKGDGLVVSPADGVVHKIEEAKAPEELKLEDATYKRVSIFLSVFNVHVNRVPVAGKITNLHYRSGKFLNAAAEKASVDNERQSCVVETSKGEKVIFVQIAGLIAKRIVCDLSLEQQVKTGVRFGIIRFGSRMDVYLPKDTKVEVEEGQTMVGGETILAKLTAPKKTVKKVTKTITKK
jgi:phosphatidylserine decarboxylase